MYDWAVLADILQNYSSLSEAKVALYEKHKKDLKDLKKLVRENLSREEYQRLFAKRMKKLIIMRISRHQNNVVRKTFTVI